MVVFRPPTTWGRYRHILTIHLIASAFLDRLILYTELTLYAPLPLVGFRYRAAPEVGTPVLVLVFVSLASLIAYRHQAVLPPGHPFRFTGRVKALIAVAIFVIACAIGIAIWQVFKSRTSVILMPLNKRYSCAASKINTHILISYYLGNDWFFVTIALIAAVAAWTLIVSLIVHAYYILSSHKTLSEKTRALQRSLIKTLIIQILIPSVLGIAAVTPFYFMHIFGVFNPKLIEALVLMVSFHGTLTFTMVLLLTKPFRQFLIFKFSSVFLRVRSNNVRPAQGNTATHHPTLY